MGTGASNHPEYAFYVPDCKNAVINERRKVSKKDEEENIKTKHLRHEEIRARAKLKHVQTKHHQRIQRENAEETAKATASYFKSESPTHHRRLSKLRSVHVKGDLFADAVSATAKRASVDEEPAGDPSERRTLAPIEQTNKTSEQNKPSKDKDTKLKEKCKIPSQVKTADSTKIGNTRDSQETKNENSRTFSSKPNDKEKGSGAKDKVKETRHMRLSKLHSLPKHEEDLFANAVAATAHRASVSLPDENSRIERTTLAPIEHTNETSEQNKLSKDKDTKLKEKGKISSQVKTADSTKIENTRDSQETATENSRTFSSKRKDGEKGSGAKDKVNMVKETKRRRLSKLHSLPKHEEDLFANAVAATAHRASVSPSDGNSKIENEIPTEQPVPIQPSRAGQPLREGGKPARDTKETENENNQQISPKPNDKEKGSGAKDKVKETRRRRLSKLHSLPKHEEDLFANAVAATAHRASVSLPDDNSRIERTTLAPIEQANETSEQNKPSKDKDTKLKEKGKISSQVKTADSTKIRNNRDRQETTTGNSRTFSSKPKDEEKGSGAKDKVKETRRRRLSKLHSLPKHEEDLFANAVAATARRASVSPFDGNSRIGNEVPTEQPVPIQPSRAGQPLREGGGKTARDTKETKNENSRKISPKPKDEGKGSGAKDEVKKTKHRRLSKLHSLPKHEQDLFANAVAATAHRASVSLPDDNSRIEMPIEQPVSTQPSKHSIDEQPREPAKESGETSSHTLPAVDRERKEQVKPIRHKRVSKLSRSRKHEEDQASTAGADHVYVRSGRSRTRCSSQPSMPPIDEYAEEVTPSQPDPIAEQFNQAIGSLKTQAGNALGDYNVTLTYQQFMDVITGVKTLREAIEDSMGTRLCLPGDASDEKVVDGRSTSVTKTSGIIAENTVLDITEVTKDSEELVENLIQSVSQLLAVRDSKTSEVNDFVGSNEVTTTSTEATILQNDTTDNIREEDISEEPCKNEEITKKWEIESDTRLSVLTLDPKITETSGEFLQEQGPGKKISVSDFPPEAALDIALNELDIQLNNMSKIPLPKSVTEAAVCEDQDNARDEATVPADKSIIIQTEDVGDIPTKTLTDIPTKLSSDICTESTGSNRTKARSAVLNAPVVGVISDDAANLLNEAGPNIKPEDLAGVPTEPDAKILAATENIFEPVATEVIEAVADVQVTTSPDVTVEASFDILNEVPSGIQNETSVVLVKTASDVQAETVADIATEVASDIQTKMSNVLTERIVEATTEDEAGVDVPANVSADVVVDVHGGASFDDPVEPVAGTLTETSPNPMTAVDANIKSDISDDRGQNGANITQPKPPAATTEAVAEVEVVNTEFTGLSHIPPDISHDVQYESLTADVQTDMAHDTVSSAVSESSTEGVAEFQVKINSNKQAEPTPVLPLPDELPPDSKYIREVPTDLAPGSSTELFISCEQAELTPLLPLPDEVYSDSEDDSEVQTDVTPDCSTELCIGISSEHAVHDTSVLPLPDSLPPESEDVREIQTDVLSDRSTELCTGISSEQAEPTPVLPLPNVLPPDSEDIREVQTDVTPDSSTELFISCEKAELTPLLPLPDELPPDYEDVREVQTDVAPDNSTELCIGISSEQAEPISELPLLDEMPPDSEDVREIQTNIAPNIATDLRNDISSEATSDVPPATEMDISEPSVHVKVAPDATESEDLFCENEEDIIAQTKYRLTDLEKDMKLAVPDNIAEGSLENLLIEDILSSTTDIRLIELPDLPTPMGVAGKVFSKPRSIEAMTKDSNHGSTEDSKADRTLECRTKSDTKSTQDALEEESAGVPKDAKDVVTQSDEQKDTIQENDVYPITESQLDCFIREYAGISLSQESIGNVTDGICEGLLPESSLPNKNTEENDSELPSYETSDNTTKS